MNDLFALKLFTRVARLGSFSKAARELRVTQPHASRLVAGLENDLGTALLSRTTRTVVLTDAGAEYLFRVQAILDALEDANQDARGTTELAGELRIGLPTSIAIREIIPRLPHFTMQHPGLRLSLLMDDQRQDLLRDGVDIALRFGELDDSTATARLIATNQRLLVASPAYLARRGTPRVPSDLQQHSIIVAPPSMKAADWIFTKNTRRVAVKVEPSLIVSVNEAATTAAVAGLGIVLTGLFACRAELASGTLVRLLADWQQPDSPVHAVFPYGRATKRAARTFVDYLAAELRTSLNPVQQGETAGSIPTHS